jgi:hypothetical protein
MVGAYFIGDPRCQERRRPTLLDDAFHLVEQPLARDGMPRIATPCRVGGIGKACNDRIETVFYREEVTPLRKVYSRHSAAFDRPRASLQR